MTDHDSPHMLRIHREIAASHVGRVDDAIEDGGRLSDDRIVEILWETALIFGVDVMQYVATRCHAYGIDITPAHIDAAIARL